MTVVAVTKKKREKESEESPNVSFTFNSTQRLWRVDACVNSHKKFSKRATVSQFVIMHCRSNLTNTQSEHRVIRNKIKAPNENEIYGTADEPTEHTDCDDLHSYYYYYLSFCTADAQSYAR